MNKSAVRANFEDRCIALSKWCKKHNLSYPATSALLNRNSKILETSKQRQIIEFLKADGLYVSSEGDDVSASTGMEG